MRKGGVGRLVTRRAFSSTVTSTCKPVPRSAFYLWQPALPDKTIEMGAAKSTSSPLPNFSSKSNKVSPRVKGRQYESGLAAAIAAAPFEGGHDENFAILADFRKQFDSVINDVPAGEKKYGSSERIQLGLEMAVAYVKNYALDSAEELFIELKTPCEEFGLPWNCKWLQDVATLRCKQNRQADALVLLEKLASQVPPNVPTLVNLGTVCNQLGLLERALGYFEESVKVKGGTWDRDDYWQVGLVKKNMGQLDEAQKLLDKALDLYLVEVGDDDPIMVAKVYDSVGACCNKREDFSRGAELYVKAYNLFNATVGPMSPLTGWAANGAQEGYLGMNDFKNHQFFLKRAFEVECTKDGIHPTPLHGMLGKLLELHTKSDSNSSDLGPLDQYHKYLEAAIENLTKRNMANDGNFGVVLHEMGRLYMMSGHGFFPRALELFIRAQDLLAQVTEVDLSFLLLTIKMEIDMLTKHAATKAAQ
eukprot:gene710-91_t